MPKENNKTQKELKRVETQPNTTISRYIKGTEYEQFCEWSALPFIARKKMGVPTQLEFAKKYGVNHQTLTAWKHRDDFEIKKNKHMKSWMRELSPNVFLALYKKAIKEDFDNPKYIEIWLKYVEGWNPNAKPEPKADDYVNTNDIQALVKVLPVEKQQRFYSIIRELLDEAQLIANSELTASA